MELRRLARCLPDQRLELRIESLDMLVRVQSLYGMCLADSIHELLCAQRDILSPEHPHTLFTMDLVPVTTWWDSGCLASADGVHSAI